MTSTHPTSVPFTYQDRQWDGRFNVQTDDDLERLVTALRREWDAGKLKYILCSGVEIGTRPYQDDYQVRHVHTAAIFHNRVSKSAILKNWDIKQGNGYYLVPRNRDLPYGGWRDHHTKVFSKIDVTKPVLFEMGDLPEDVERKKPVGPSEEEKKRKVDEILIDIRGLEEGCEEEAFRKYPRNYLIYGERLKAMVSQKKEFFNANGDPHIYLHGYPGTGKSAVLAYVYPKYYKKNLYNKFFDLYDPKVHTHIMLEDLDFEAVERLSINFLKTICDESGFPIDQKYKAPPTHEDHCIGDVEFRATKSCSGHAGRGSKQKGTNASFLACQHLQLYATARSETDSQERTRSTQTRWEPGSLEDFHELELHHGPTNWETYTSPRGVPADD